MTSVARILIVDDDRSIRRTLEKFLGGEGYDVATAQDAPGAIAAVNSNVPASPEAIDLMLLDLGLPGGSGFDVLNALADRLNPANWTDADQITAGLQQAAEALERLSHVFAKRRRRGRRRPKEQRPAPGTDSAPSES